jgi:hypothetical protein
MLARPHNDRFPLFDAKKQQKTLIPALRRPNATLQVVDSNRLRREFPYAVEQRNFCGPSGQLNG